MNEEARERRIDAIPHEPAYAARVVALPDRIRRQHDVGRPSGNRARRQQHGVADGLIAPAAPVEHSCEHRHVEIRVVVDADLALAVVEAVQAAGVLRDRASPRDRQRQEQRVEAGIIEPFADVLAGRQDDPRLVAGNGREPVSDGLSLLLAEPGPQGNQVPHPVRESSLETVQVVIAFGQHEG